MFIEQITKWFRGADPVASDEHPRPEIPVDPGPRVLERFGAWCGSGSMASSKTIARDVAFAKWLGFTRLDVIVNDHSGNKAERIFDTYTRAKIVALCAAATAAGIEINLMSWIMPHERYLRDGMTVLLELLEQTKAASIMFDAEEPWTQARKPMPYDEAAGIVAEMLKGHRWGVTGIGYASEEKLGPLVRASAYMVPQAYVTASSNLDPSHDPFDLSRRWQRIFGSRDLVVGLAAYRQVGIPGYTVDQALRACFTSANAAKPVAISWWSLAQIRSSSKVASSIRDLVTHMNGSLLPRVPEAQEIA